MAVGLMAITALAIIASIVDGLPFLRL
jgi:hypothetical protein